MSADNSPRLASGSSWFDNLGGAQIEKLPDYPFHLRVLLAGPRVTPRRKSFTYWMEMGRGLIEPIIFHRPLPMAGDGLALTFVFPERWMSVHEQHLFISRLEQHPEAGRIKQVDILTQNVLIVGCLPAGALRVFSFPDDDPEAGLTDKDV